jgi:hypothetical protein
MTFRRATEPYRGHSAQAQENSGDLRRPLSPIEQGLLLHYFYETEGAYVDQMVCDIVGELDVRLFEETLQRLVATHESLRTCYIREAGLEMTGVVRSPSPRHLDVIDLSAEADAQAVVNRRVAEAEVQFDLSKQVSRCALYRFEKRVHVFAWTYHHVVADSWTLRLLQEQFCAIYRVLLEGATPNQSKATPYSAYVDWIANQDQNSALSSWTAYLKGFRSRKVKALAPSVGRCRSCLGLTLPLETRNQVDEVRRRYKVTKNVVLLAMWGIFALDQQQSSECLLGCVVFGRSIPVRGIETVAGVCANTVPIVIDGSKPIRDLFADLQRDVFAASARSYLAVSDVLASVGLSHRDLHSVVNFTIDERAVRNKHINHLPFSISNIRYKQAANFDAYLDVEAHDTGIDIAIHFDPACRYFVANETRRKCEQILSYFAHHDGGTVRNVLDALLIEPGRVDVEFAFDAPPSNG